MTTPLVLIPGMGADARMFSAQLAAFPDAHVPAWPPLVPGESLRDFAARLAATLTLSAETVLAGASMGGMIALEIARRVPVRAVVLIGSCDHPRSIPRALHLAEFMTRPIPTFVLEWFRVADRLTMGRLGPLTPAQQALILAMARDHSMAFIRWAGRAILTWPGVGSTTLSRPVLRIHGALDRMILPPAAADVLLPDSGHLPSITHPDAVNSLLARACTLTA